MPCARVGDHGPLKISIVGDQGHRTSRLHPPRIKAGSKYRLREDAVCRAYPQQAIVSPLPPVACTPLVVLLFNIETDVPETVTVALPPPLPKLLLLPVALTVLPSINAAVPALRFTVMLPPFAAFEKAETSLPPLTVTPEKLLEKFIEPEPPAVSALTVLPAAISIRPAVATVTSAVLMPEDLACKNPPLIKTPLPKAFSTTERFPIPPLSA